MRRFFVGLALVAALGVIPCRANGNDRQIAQKISDTLQEHKDRGELRGINIDLQVENGAVYLQGHVADEEQEKIALDAARHAEGVKKVYNELSISKSESPKSSKSKSASVASHIALKDSGEEEAEVKTDDSQEVLNRIYAKLSDEKESGRLRDFALDLEVDDGIVTLKGTVASIDHQKRVLDIVRRVPGVSQVINGITVETKNAKSSDQLAQEVIRRLKAKKDSGELKSFRLDVQVEEGIVWLSGYVADEEQRQLVLETARYIPGVAKVVNDLAIGGQKRAVPVKAASDNRQVRNAPTPPPEDGDEPIGINAPRALANYDGAIGSSVAGGISRRPTFAEQPSVPAPGLAASDEEGNIAATGAQGGGKQSVKYVWVPANQLPPTQVGHQAPLAFAPARSANYQEIGGVASSPTPVPLNPSIPASGIAAARFDHPQMPNYAWPSYAPYPNYGAVTYPKQYSPMAWPYIGPFYPYPQVPLGWRKVTLEWDDGWWHLDFKSRH